MTVRVLERCFKSHLKQRFFLPEACLWLPSHVNTLLPEPCYWEADNLGTRNCSFSCKSSPAHKQALAPSRSSNAGSPLSPPPWIVTRKLERAQTREIISFSKSAISHLNEREFTFNRAKLNKGKLNYCSIWTVLRNCRTGTEGTTLCQEKAPADEPDHQQGQSPQTQRVSARHQVTLLEVVWCPQCANPMCKSQR